MFLKLSVCTHIRWMMCAWFSHSLKLWLLAMYGELISQYCLRKSICVQSYLCFLY